MDEEKGEWADEIAEILARLVFDDAVAQDVHSILR